MHSPFGPPLSTELLLRAYRSGIFPMADHREDDDIFWVEPNERAILPLDGFHLSRSLRKAIRSDRFRVTCDQAFDAVIAACAEPREEHAESWISRRIETGYRALFQAGHAHSVECWADERLVGGLYGVAFDQVFCGESMFSRADNASKVALAWLVAAMRQSGYRLLDCQFMTTHLASLGAVTVTKAEYLKRLAAARERPVASLPDTIGSWSDMPLASGHSEKGDQSSDAALSPGSSSSPGKLIAQFLTQTS